MPDLPTADDFFGPAAAPGKAGQLPTSDQFFGPQQATGTMPDFLFQQGPRANVLNAFGQGVEQGWGAEPLGMSDETAEFLKKSGVFNDAQEGHQSWLRTFNEALLRPAATALDATMRGGAALLRGAQAGVEAIGEQAEAGGIPGATSLARDIAALPEAFPRGTAELGLPVAPVPTERPISPGATAAAVEALTPPDLANARSLGVIGEGEAGWKGTAEPTEPGGAADEARAASIKQVRAAAAAEQPGLETAQAPAEPEAPAPDIHSVARQIDPDTFSQYDALTARRDTYRRWLDDLAETRQQDAEATAPHAAEIADLQQRLETATGRRAATYRNRLGPMVEERDAYVADQISRDSPDMTRVRDALQKNDFGMRDLAPQVSAAYRQAQAQMPTPAVPEAAAAPEPVPGIQVTAAPEQAATTPTEAPPAAAPRPTVPDIHDDAYQKLVAAGRPPEEANAAAALVAAHYDARAARFGGTKGTGAELYAAEAPKIEAGPEGAKASGATVLRNGAATIRLMGRADASTFVHEIGHAWLEELLRDAGEDGASEDLLGDAKAVRDWLGVEEPEAPKLPSVPDGSIRFFHAGNEYEGGKRWLSEDRGWVTNFRPGLPVHYVDIPEKWLEDHMIGKSFDDTGTDQRAPYSNFEAPEEIAKQLKKIPEATAAPILTRAHEKFARGFERYLMEGRAPSRNLAGVFDQFKQWLTQIYQTVSRLRSPITDDIRGVFDRMLALPGREPVIAPDMEIPRNFADEHETLAESTPPAMAHGAAERVRAEADRKALEEAPEVYNELTGRGPEPRSAGSVAPGNAPEGVEPGGDGAEAGPRPEPTPTPVTTGAVGAGRGEVAPEGAGVGAATATAERPPAGPNAAFARQPESRFADRAGNIRLDLLGTPEDVNQAIRDTATENDDFLGQRRGVISDAEALQLADALGMDARQLNLRKIGQAFNAEEIIAARKLLVSSATNVRDLMAKAAQGTEEDLLAYAAAKDRHRMIQGQVAGVTAEAGRALRAFRDLEGMKETQELGRFLEEATGRTLYQLRQEATRGAALTTPSQVSKFVADSEKKGFFDWVQSYFVNALISGPATHGTYMVGNTLFELFKAGPETVATAAVGKLRTTIAGTEGERVMLGEVPAQIYGLMRGSRDGIRAAWDAFRTNETIPLPGEKIAGTTPFAKGVIPNPAGIPIGTVLESPSRMVTALHSFTRVTTYEANIAGQAYRVASKEGLTGTALARRISELTGDPTEEMMASAVEDANETAMMRRPPYGSFSQTVSHLTNLGFNVPDIPLPGGRSVPMGTLRPLKFIDPFVTISANIINASIVKRTPVGLLAPSIRADLSGANGALAFDRAAGRMLAGSTFMIAVGGLAAEKLVTGSGPSDPKQAAMLRTTGWQPYSLKLGNTYYNMHRLGVLGMQLGIAADLYDVAHAASQEDAATVAHMITHAFAQNILDESFMRGPADLVQALNDPDRYGVSFTRNFLSSFTPFSVGSAQIARTIDPYTRQARTTMDAIKAKIPYISEELEPRRDIWGEPMPSWQSVVPGVTAIYESKVNNDPVNQRMVSLGMNATYSERKIRGVDLTEAQYDDYSRIAGRLAKVRLDQIVPAHGFDQLPETAQKEIITKTISSAREAARAQIMMHNPSIIQQAIANKTAGLHARP